LHIAPATLTDAHYLKSRLRQVDRAEVEAGTGRKAEEILPLSFSVSSVAYTVRETAEGNPIAMFGAAPSPHNSYLGVVWMLCTSKMSKVSKAFLKEMPTILNQLSLVFPDGLHNLALFHPSRDKYLRWIEKAGFTLDYDGILKRGEHHFIYFYRKP
jgi:hypothetical protein